MGKPRSRGSGEGSVFQLPSGKYRAELYLGVDATGKKLVWRCDRKLRREAAEELAKAIKERAEGQLMFSSSQTVAQFAAMWLPSRTGIRRITQNGYEKDLRLHILPALGEIKLQKLRPQHCQQFVTTVADKGLSPYTIRRAYAVLRRMLRDAVKWQLIPTNPALLADLPQLPQPERNWLEPEQAKAFLSECHGDDYEALFVVALTTGLRAGELRGLEWGDIDWQHKTLTVQRRVIRLARAWDEDEPKSRSSQRTIPLVDITIEALHRQRARQLEWRLRAGAAWQESAHIFTGATGEPYSSPHLVNCHLLPLLARAGLPRIRLHDLRHSAASLLLALDVPLKVIQEIMGHSNISVTANTYAHTMSSLHVDAMDKLGRLLQNE